MRILLFSALVIASGCSSDVVRDGDVGSGAAAAPAKLGGADSTQAAARDGAATGGAATGGAAVEEAGSSRGDAPILPASEAGFRAGYDDGDCNLQTELDPTKAGSPGNLIASARNPNGDSELAVLMRRFVDDLRDNKLLCEAGQPVRPMHDAHRMMRCAWPTVPSERDEGFDQRSVAYLHAVRSFETEPSKGTYNAVLSSCVACHQVSCSGVIEFIEGLRWQ